MIKKFTAYDNHYFIFCNLSQKAKEKIALAYFEYMFEDKEPNFTFEDNREEYCAWNNLLQLLSKNKNKIKKSELNSKVNSGVNSGVDSEVNSISILVDYYISNISNVRDKRLLREKINEWLEYKQERKDKSYTEIGLNKLLKQIENNITKYGEDKVINLIDECMASNYQGIIFDKLKKENKSTGYMNNYEKSQMVLEEFRRGYENDTDRN